MSMLFANTLKKLRTEKGLSQNDIAKQMFVTRSTVGRWENGVRLPDAEMISRLSEVLGVDVNFLLSTAAQSDDYPNVIMVDDNKIILTGGLPILEEVMPNATVTGFTNPSEALEYAKAHRVALAFLDIEMERVSGLDVCNKLLEVNPRTNVVFLTAYSEYSLDAWNTGAIGFMLKPVTPEGVKKQLEKLRYPFWTGGGEIIVENDGPGFNPANDNEPHIALNNIRQRLEMMCRGKLEINPRECGGTVVTVYIPQERNQTNQ